MKNLVLKIATEELEEFEQEVRNLVLEYISGTASYLDQHYLELGTAFTTGEPCPDEIEKEADALIEISRLSAEIRARLSYQIIIIRKISFKIAAKRPEDEIGDVYDSNGFTSIESSYYDAVRKLESHLATMPTDLSDEKSLRDLLQSRLQNDGVHGLLKYLHNNPESSKLRTAETVYFLAEQVHSAMEEKSRLTPWDYVHDQRKISSLRDSLHKRHRKPLWFEQYIPQHDGWALSLGDHLESITPQACDNWKLLFELCHSNSGSKPTSRFAKSAIAFTVQVPEKDFTGILNQIEASMSARSPIWVWTKTKGIREESMYCDNSVAMIRTIIRLTQYYPNRRTVVSLERILVHCFEKINGIGPRNESLGQETLNALLAIPSDGKLTFLNDALKRFKKNKLVKRRIEKAIESCGI